MAFAAAPAVEAASELDAWSLCYQINLFFRYKQRLRVPFLCQKCGKLDRSAYRSSFVCKAVQCPQGHRPKRTVCAKCDENLVLNISRRRETCFFEKRCRFHLRVDVEAIKGIVKDAKLLDRYAAFVDENRAYECNIHCDLVPITDDDARRPTEACRHDKATCDVCLKAHIESKVNSGGWQSLQCPDPLCRQAMTIQDVIHFGTKESYRKYEEQHFMADMSRRSDFHWCRGRSGKCDWGQLLPEGTKTWECRKCGGLNCGLEHHIAHPGLTCKEFVVGVWVDPEAMRFIRRTHKQCPGAGCKAWIEKAGQCHKMECKASLGGCGIYFCWECKVIFPAGVHEHLYSCEKRNGYCGGKGVPKPGQKDPKYKPNWDKDLEFVGTGKEYSGIHGQS